MQLITIPRKDFVIVSQPETPDGSKRVFSFYGSKSNGFETDYERLLGSFIGDPYQNDSFKRKLDYIGGLLRVRGVPFFQTVSPYSEKEQKKMTAEQKKKRALSKLNNYYNNQMLAIEKNGGMFTDDLKEALNREYKQTMQEIYRRYQVN